MCALTKGGQMRVPAPLLWITPTDEVPAPDGSDGLVVVGNRAAVPYVGPVASPRRGAAVLSELDVPADLAARYAS
jgi:hypothetical protein